MHRSSNGFTSATARTRLLAASAIGLLLGLAATAAPAGAADPARDIPTAAYTVPGLSQPAEILVDAWGVPHIYTNDLYDAFLVQGFNAARDRLWQIDLWRKRGLGQLAEDFGPSYAEQDKAARLFLYRGDMYREWLAYGSDAKRIAEAFVAGVNAYVALAKRDPDLLPVEFKILGYEPSLWQPEDVVRIRSHGLVRNVASEVERARVACRAGLEVDEIRQGLEPPWQAEVPDGLDPCVIPTDVLEVYDLATQGVSFSEESLGAGARRAAAPVDGRGDPEALGSNNWAIAPERSATGRPILANDPHRTHSVPALRYIAHLSAPTLDVIGAGEPALPGISIGHNGTIAFGLTIFSIDQEDLYVYDTNPQNPDEYRYEGRWVPMETVTERVAVREQDPVTAELRFTRHGPVVHQDRERHKAYAVRAAWLEPGMAPYFGSIDYMRARNWDEFLAAMNRWGAPSENQVYADVAGNIGWAPGGLTPVRPNWDGLLPVPGDGRYEWAGFLDMDQLPREANPERGWVATANQMNLPEGYPHAELKVGFEWTEPWRYLRLTEVLGAADKVSIVDSMQLQTDLTSVPARRITAVLKDVEVDAAVATVGQGQQGVEGAPVAAAPGGPEEGGEAPVAAPGAPAAEDEPPPAAADTAKLARAVDLLTAWDHRVAPDSAAAALFEVWFTKHLRPALVTRLVPEDVRDIVEDGDTRVLVGLIENPDERFGEDPGRARDEVLLTSLSAAIAEVEEHLGPDPEDWSWGELHVAYFEHPLSGLLDDRAQEVFNVGPLPKGGSRFTVNNQGYRASDFHVTSGASWRMVIDVGNWDNSWAVSAPGQSGDPTSPHYRDLFVRWAADTYFPLVYSREAVERVAEERITLRPAER